MNLGLIAGNGRFPFLLLDAARAQVDADMRTTVDLAAQESLSKGLTTVSDAGSPPETIELKLSPATVRVHLRNAYSRAGVSSRAALRAWLGI